MRANPPPPTSVFATNQFPQTKIRPIPAIESKAFVTLNEASLRADLGYIASHKLAGRMSLEAGDDLSIQWVAEQFAKAGLKAAATSPDGKPSYLQSFEVI